ncbi:hypothetical protein RJ641_012676 [Dillenia turbinata]|uniref:Protein kinase domain-containing protein n=1 Tax=Dillenia turbinata TaxID=194707 RepID=A0AAN8Z0S6_9MAGN
MALAYAFIFIAAMNIVFSQPMNATCVLDIQLSSAENSTTCRGGDWGGFLNHTCCDAYLSGLARRANQTDISGSSSVTDVEDMLGNTLSSLEDDCKNLGVISKSDKSYHACSRRWANLDVSSSTSNNATGEEYDVCSFAVLVTLMSTKVDDKIWVEKVFGCLGEQNFAADEREKVGSKSKLALGLWILIGVGIGIFLIAQLIKDSVSGESACLKIRIKDIYSATNNFHVSNFIGQEIAGKVYKGILSDSQHVAFKQIMDDEYAVSPSHVRHPNHVALLGYCEGDENSFLVLVLCRNGNLSEWLFGQGSGSILCKFKVRGTFGYFDPEYQKNHRVNASGDVYNFGIVLLHVLSGQRVINLDLSRPMPIDKMAKMLIRGGNVAEFADKKLMETTQLKLSILYSS